MAFSLASLFAYFYFAFLHLINTSVELIILVFASVFGPGGTAHNHLFIFSNNISLHLFRGVLESVPIKQRIKG